MINFTDGFFEFPIRIYDGFSMEKAMDEMDKTGEVSEGLWIRGLQRLPAEELYSCSWHEYYSEPDVEKAIAMEIEKEGSALDCTIITKKSGEKFFCTWRKGKLEKAMNEFFRKLNDAAEAYAQESIEEE